MLLCCITLSSSREKPTHAQEVAAIMLYLELLQMTAPLYVSGLLLRVIWIGFKAFIDVTLYDELFITSITEKNFLSPL